MNSPAPTTRTYRLLLLGGGLAILGLIVGVPFFSDSWNLESRSTSPWHRRLLFATLKGVTVAYFFFIGSAFGSFINVVAYRMPLGKSVVTRGSSCPRCRHSIRSRDNLPVIGWLCLGGRCRHCGLTISRRYPLVECWFGMVATLLLLFEVLTGGANLPGIEPPFRAGVVEMVWGLHRPVFYLYGFHFFLLTALSTLALFKLDRNRIPWKAGGLFALVLAVLPILFPNLHPVAGLPATAGEVAVPQWLDVLLGGLLGCGVGLALEWGTAESGFNGLGAKGFWLAGTLCGLGLGWQATLSAALLFSLLFFFSRFLTGFLFLARGPILALFALAVLMQICFWKPLAEIPFWPGAGFATGSSVAAVLMGAAMIVAAVHLVPGGDGHEVYQPEGYGDEDPDSVAGAAQKDRLGPLEDVPVWSVERPSAGDSDHAVDDPPADSESRP